MSRLPGEEGVWPGIDVLLRDRIELVHDRRVGLITNQAGVDRELTSSIDRVRSSAGIRLTTLFGPEHGVWGALQAGVPVEDGTDARTGLLVYSLYGQTKKPTPEMLAGLDVLVCDLQDAGCRFWTNLYTMAYAMQAAKEVGLPFVVLDRPNPLGGRLVEGNVLHSAFASFVGLYPIPIRHGLTMGEAARLFNQEFGIGAELTVVPATGWRRSLHFGDTGLHWIPPSPNTPTADTVLLYPGTCLFEGTVLSEGRGTTRPFEWIGAPWLDPHALADDLNGRALPGVRFRPAYFAPTFSKHAGAVCGGVQVHVTDRYAVRAVAVGLHLLDAVRRQDPERFGWRKPGSGTRYFIDLLAGTDGLRAAIDGGARPEDILTEWEPGRAAFERMARAYHLYPD